MKNFRSAFPYITETSLPDNINDLLEERAFDGLSDSQRYGQGWSKIGEDRMINVDDKYLLRHQMSKRSADKAAVQRLVKERADRITEEGREITSELMEELNTQAENEVIKYAAISTNITYILIWPAKRLLLVAGGTASKCEKVLSFLRKTLDGLDARPWNDSYLLSMAVTKVMTTGSSVYKLPPTLAISPFGKTLFNGEDSSLKIVLDGVSNDTDDAKNMLLGMTARSVEMSLQNRPDNGQIENLANFNLVMPKNGNVHFKAFDYDDDAERDDYYQDLIAEIHIVSNYAIQIMTGLENFIGENPDGIYFTSIVKQE